MLKPLQGVPFVAGQQAKAGGAGVVEDRKSREAVFLVERTVERPDNLSLALRKIGSVFGVTIVAALA